jgi:hypothetical protein
MAKWSGLCVTATAPFGGLLTIDTRIRRLERRHLTAVSCSLVETLAWPISIAHMYRQSKRLCNTYSQLRATENRSITDSCKIARLRNVVPDRFHEAVKQTLGLYSLAILTAAKRQVRQACSTARKQP